MKDILLSRIREMHKRVVGDYGVPDSAADKRMLLNGELALAAKLNKYMESYEIKQAWIPELLQEQVELLLQEDYRDGSARDEDEINMLLANAAEVIALLLP